MIERLALGFDAADVHRTRAFGHVVDRATEAYGTAMHYADAEDPEDARAAMSAAMEAAARGFAAAAVEAITQDDVLKLSAEQKARLNELAIGLDQETVELLHGA